MLATAFIALLRYCVRLVGLGRSARGCYSGTGPLAPGRSARGPVESQSAFIRPMTGLSITVSSEVSHGLVCCISTFFGSFYKTPKSASSRWHGPTPCLNSIASCAFKAKTIGVCRIGGHCL